jgi:hypothetical protein
MIKKSTGAARETLKPCASMSAWRRSGLRKLQAKAEANKPKKVTLPKLKFLDEK